MIVLDTSANHFILRKNVVCFEYDKSESKNLVTSAESACAIDHECIGVYDDYCDRNDEQALFHLCKDSFIEYRHVITPCIYQKMKYEGGNFSKL